MTPAVRELVDRVASIGWSLDGYTDGGHIALTHTTGARYTIPATPSDHRSLRNTLAALERIAGAKVSRPNAGKYRRGLPTSPTAQDLASRARHIAEVQRREAQRTQARAIEAADRQRRDIERLMRP